MARGRRSSGKPWLSDASTSWWWEWDYATQGLAGGGLTISVMRLIILPAPVSAFIAYPALGVATGAQGNEYDVPKTRRIV